MATATCIRPGAHMFGTMSGIFIQLRRHHWKYQRTMRNGLLVRQQTRTVGYTSIGLVDVTTQDTRQLHTPTTMEHTRLLWKLKMQSHQPQTKSGSNFPRLTSVLLVQLHRLPLPHPWHAQTTANKTCQQEPLLPSSSSLPQTNAAANQNQESLIRLRQLQTLIIMNQTIETRSC